MNTRLLSDLGQSLWLDNINRDLLDSGTLARYIDEWSITGVTSNPTIFDEAIAGSSAYDCEIRDTATRSLSDEEVFLTLALADLCRAADLLRPVFERTGSRDGWVSMEVSPLLLEDSAGTVVAATRIFERAQRPNFFVKVPGTPAGINALEQLIFEGVPVNVTLLFSAGQYANAAEAYLRAIERRLGAGRDARVASVASLFVSRWDRAIHDRVSSGMRNRLGIAMAGVTYARYRGVLESERWRRLAARGALPQRLLWASTGTKDPEADDCLYVESLAAPDTVNTLPEKTLRAFVDHGHVRGIMPADAADAMATLKSFEGAGIDLVTLADRLQVEGGEAFANSWGRLMTRLAVKRGQASAA